MQTQQKSTIGTMACMCCGREIPVKQGTNGTINVACSWCDFPAWAKKGSEAARIIGARMTPVAVSVQEHIASVQAAPKPQAVKPAPPAPAPAPAPAPSAKRMGIFHGL
jgi:hypothetical protein